MKTKGFLFDCRWVFGIITIFFLMLGLSQSVSALDAQDYPLGDIPLDDATYQLFMKPVVKDRVDMLPSSYDARDDGIVSPAKDQGICGSCWAFASVGAMESHLKKQYNVGLEDLSEEQQSQCNTAMWGCDGGYSTAIQYWEKNGPVTEACYPYTATDGNCSQSCVEMDYRVTDFYTVTQTVTGFKQSLYDDGPSYWSFIVYSDFPDFWDHGNPGDVYQNDADSYAEGGHAVLIIGWDDAKGAFLCKNSWGETGGPNNDGTFWIAYSGHSYGLGFGMANFTLTTVGGGDWSFCFQDPLFMENLALNVEGNQIRGQAILLDDPDYFPAPITGYLNEGYAYFAINYLGENTGLRFYVIHVGSKTGYSWGIDDAGMFYDDPRAAELVFCGQASETSSGNATGVFDGAGSGISKTMDGTWDLCFYDPVFSVASLEFNVEGGGLIRGQCTSFPAPLTGRIFNGNAFFAIGYLNDHLRMYAVSAGSLSGFGWAIRGTDSTYYEDPHSITLFPCDAIGPVVQNNNGSGDNSKNK